MNGNWRWILAVVIPGVVGCSLAWGVEPVERGRARDASLEAQLAGTERRAAAGGSFSEWQWEYQRYINVGSAEPARLFETVRVRFASRGESSVRVTFRAVAGAGGFGEGKFRGRKEVSYAIERVYERVVIRGKRFFAQARGPFRLVEAEPSGETLADFSTLGGIARGKNMVAVVDEAFGGENLFALDGVNLGFVNQQAAGTNGRAFPKEIVLEPVK